MNPDEFVQYLRDIIPKVKSVECRYSMASNDGVFGSVGQIMGGKFSYVTHNK